MLSYGFTKIPSHVDCWASRQCLFQYSGWGKPQCATVHVCNAFPTLCMFPMPVSPWPCPGPHIVDVKNVGKQNWYRQACAAAVAILCKEIPGIFRFWWTTYSGQIWFKGSINVQQITSTLNLFVTIINCRIIKLQMLIAHELCIQ